MKSHGGPPSRSLFYPRPRHRPIVVMVDDQIRKNATSNSKARYLLDHLGDDFAEAFLYSDDGAPAGTPRPINLDDGVEAPKGWVEIGPGATDRLCLVGWTKEGRSTEGVITIEDSAFERVINAVLPEEYLAKGSPETLRLADAHAMLAAKKIQADRFVTDRVLPFALGRDSWSPVTLMTPDDALPVVGLRNSAATPIPSR